MDITNEFVVPVDVERAWEVLTDLPRIAPCLPGAKLTGTDGDSYKGTVRIKVGPITANYSGTATFTSLDVASKVAVLRAEGRETKGQGNASASVTARLFEVAEGTRVVVDADLSISGRVAQFGRGVFSEVSAKLMGEFAAALADLISSPEPSGEQPTEELAAQEPGTSTVETTPGAASSVSTPKEETESSLNLLGVVAKPLAKRIAPVAAIVAVIVYLLKRRHR